MSNFLPPNVIKATQGDYRIPIKLIFIEAWQQLIKMPKAFWQAFGLVVLVSFGATIFMDWLLRLYDIGIIHFQNHQAQLPNLHTLHVLNSLKGLFMSFTGAVIQILRLLLTVSLVFLALNQIRNQPIKVTMVFAFLKNWRSLLLISLLFYLVNSVLHHGLYFLFEVIHLFPQSHYLPNPIFASILYLVLLTLLYSYILTVAFIASLLVLDQKLMLKNSLRCAFKSINQHWFKNSVLLFLLSWAYMSAWGDASGLFFSIRNGYPLLAYLILLPGIFMTILFILYKKMANQTNLSTDETWRARSAVEEPAIGVR
jgi:hypothetical protein